MDSERINCEIITLRMLKFFSLENPFPYIFPLSPSNKNHEKKPLGLKLSVFFLLLYYNFHFTL